QAESETLCNDDQGWIDGWDNDTIRFVHAASNGDGTTNGSPVQPPKRVDPRDTEWQCTFAFGSAHPTMTAVFCDGSVHGIRFDIAPTSWVRLCIINDGVSDFRE